LLGRKRPGSVSAQKPCDIMDWPPWVAD